MTLTKKYHILNGDHLKKQLPKQIYGEVIITRECLVDGEVSGEPLNKLFENRSRFISTYYEGFSKEDYYQQSVSEFERIMKIPNGSEINLWFEDEQSRSSREGINRNNR